MPGPREHDSATWARIGESELGGLGPGGDAEDDEREERQEHQERANHC